MAYTKDAAPRGTRQIVKAFLDALDKLPAASQDAVAKAALPALRETLATRKAKAKAAAAKIKAKTTGARKATKSTRTKAATPARSRKAATPRRPRLKVVPTTTETVAA